MKPVLFENRDMVNDEKAENYGYSFENPILAVSVNAGYDFLNRLAVRGGTVAYVRLGARSGKQGRIIDVYEVTVTTKTLFFKKQQVYTLYIDPHATTNSNKAPKPFFLL